ncbi:helix-turn-helix transcriptional regulator [Lacticaseibacillus parakribbianus]|uniref:helix-turn-helix transcriptional regulator n=1 Tax=Lacticaseibacillus parakribbianus TaxID=2970927 RepID=UPI0021CB2232|nr:WYL domain-containing protein [Lacticaseibacillus parakribbianus]
MTYHTRILDELVRLMRNEKLSREAETASGDVNVRTFYRDMATIGEILADHGLSLAQNGDTYALAGTPSDPEVLALAHLVLGSGAFTPEEAQRLVAAVLSLAHGRGQARLRKQLAAATAAYLPRQPLTPLLDLIVQLSAAAAARQAVTFTYRSTRSLERVDRDRIHTGKPATVFVDHDHFYVALFEHATTHGTPDRYRLYRLDRIQKLAAPRVNRSLTPPGYDLAAHRRQSYKLSASTHATVTLTYRGYPETLLDAFPTAKQQGKYPDPDHGWSFTVPDVAEDGVKLWALGQGPLVTITAPQRLADAVRKAALATAALYTKEAQS